MLDKLTNSGISLQAHCFRRGRYSNDPGETGIQGDCKVPVRRLQATLLSELRRKRDLLRGSEWPRSGLPLLGDNGVPGVP